MPKKSSQIAKTATVALKILWEEGYFASWKKITSIIERLAKRGNNFTGAELGMAMKRAKHLTRKGKRGNYEYIQKHPFIGNEKKKSKGKSQRK